MSVLIRGMEMPKSCDYCGFLEPFRESIGYCGILNSQIPCDCPLVPVPPHGRLIDASALENELGRFCDDNWVYNILHHAPTIFEAEED